MGIMTMHMYKAPVPMRALVPAPQEIPPGLDAVVLKCLSKKAEQRYESMDALVVDLEKLEKGQLPDAVNEMMARSGGFNVPADYFRSSKMPPPMPRSPPRRHASEARAGRSSRASSRSAAVSIAVGDAVSLRRRRRAPRPTTRPRRSRHHGDVDRDSRAHAGDDDHGGARRREGRPIAVATRPVRREDLQRRQGAQVPRRAAARPDETRDDHRLAPGLRHAERHRHGHGRQPTITLVAGAGRHGARPAPSGRRRDRRDGPGAGPVRGKPRRDSFGCRRQQKATSSRRLARTSSR